MEFELTLDDIQKLFDKLKLKTLVDWKRKRHWWLFPYIYTWEDVRQIVLLNMDTSQAIAHEAQKELFKHFKERATFMKWEWKDSKGIWDIVLDDNEMQSLLKHFELEVNDAN